MFQWGEGNRGVILSNHLNVQWASKVTLITMFMFALFLLKLSRCRYCHSFSSRSFWWTITHPVLPNLWNSLSPCRCTPFIAYTLSLPSHMTSALHDSVGLNSSLGAYILGLSSKFCIQQLTCLASLWCMCGGSVDVWTKDNLYRFIECQTHFGISRGAKMSLVVNELFIQIQRLPPIMHHKWKEIYWYYMKTTNGNSTGANSWWEVPLSYRRTLSCQILNALKNVQYSSKLEMSLTRVLVLGRWILRYHEHEPLLEDLEDEKLSKEEQSAAWESFQQEGPDWMAPVVAPIAGAPQASNPPPISSSAAPNTSLPVYTFPSPAYNISSNPQSSAPAQGKSSRCAPLTHVRQLQAEEIKAGSSTICGICNEIITWETLKRS